MWEEELLMNTSDKYEWFSYPTANLNKKLAIPKQPSLSYRSQGCFTGQYEVLEIRKVKTMASRKNKALHWLLCRTTSAWIYKI